MGVVEDRLAVLESELARVEDMLSAHIVDLARRVDVISEGQQKMLAALLAMQDRIERLERGGTDRELAVMSGFGKMLHRDML